MSDFAVNPKKALLVVAAFASGVFFVGLPVHKALSDRPKAGEELAELTVPVKLENLAVRIDTNGTVEPIESVNISPKNPGIVTRLLVGQGDAVQAGQELAIMDNQEIFAEVQRTSSVLQQRVAELSTTETRVNADIGRSQALLNQAIARLEQAQARIPRDLEQASARLFAADQNLQRAQQKAERFEDLINEGAINQENFDDVVNELRNAEANFGEAQKRLEQIDSTGSPEIESLRAAIQEAQINFEQQQRNAEPELVRLGALVEQAKAQQQIAAIRYRDTIIRAPFDGVITQKFASEGAFVTPTTSASSTASATSSSILAIAKGIEVVARVPEVDIKQIFPGQDVEIIADAFPDKIFRGRVLLVAPEAIIDNNVTSFEIRVALLSGRDFLRSKMNVDITFIGENISNTLTVPTVAIATEEGRTGVLVPDENNKPEFKPVTLGATVGDHTQIISGVQAGDKVFIDLPKGSERDRDE